MATTYKLISSVTVGSGGASSVSFTSIPQTYTDLQLLISSRADNANVFGWFTYTFNLSSGNMTSKVIEGSGTTVVSSSNATYMYGGSGVGNAATANTFGNTSIYIPNYTGSTYKSSSSDDVGESNATTVYSDLITNLLSETPAVTSIQFVPQTGSGTFRQYSTFYLYGISKA